MDNEVVIAFYNKFEKLAEEKTIKQIAEQLKSSSDWKIKRMSDFSITLKLNDFSVNGIETDFCVQIIKGVSNHVILKWS